MRLEKLRNFIFFDPKLLFYFIFKRPISLTSIFLLWKLKKEDVCFETVIDGGANVGQFARAALETFPSARIISFEPLPDIAEKLEKNLKDKSNRVWLIRAALGRKPGTVSFHRNSHSHSSSILSLHDNHRKAFPEARDVSVLKVPVTTLDIALRNEKLVAPVLLKLDLQGYELEALRGAGKTLKKVDAVLVEVSFKPMYKGEATFKEIQNFLKRKGFVFLKNLDFLKDAKGNTLQADALFVRK